MTGTTRRSAILDSAVVEFAHHGYHGARIDRIAAAAHANKQLIFHYFGSKDGLYEAVVSTLFPVSGTAGGRGATPPESVKARIAAVADWLAANPGAARALAECSSGTEVPAPAARAANAWLQFQANALRGAVEDGQRDGFFRDDVDAQAVTGIALGSLVGQSVLSGSGADGGSAPPAATLGRLIADYCAWR